MAKLYDIRAKIGQYEKDGETKNKYLTIGAVLETKNGGQMIKIDTIPVSWDGFAHLNEPYSDNANNAPADVVPTDIDNVFSIEDLPF